MAQQDVRRMEMWATVSESIQMLANKWVKPEHPAYLMLLFAALGEDSKFSVQVRGGKTTVFAEEIDNLVTMRVVEKLEALLAKKRDT